MDQTKSLNELINTVKELSERVSGLEARIRRLESPREEAEEVSPEAPAEEPIDLSLGAEPALSEPEIAVEAAGEIATEAAEDEKAAEEEAVEETLEGEAETLVMGLAEPEPVYVARVEPPAESEEPVESAAPVAPVEPSETAEPVESAAPVEPTEPSETAEPVETAAPVEPVEPSETAEPVESAAPVEPVEPAESVEPVADLFGEIETEEAPKKKKRRKAEKTLNEAEAKGGKAVIDEMAIPQAWKLDLPGEHVNDIRSAIGLNDKALFVNALFRQDNALYQDTLRILNGMKTLAEAEKYLSENFPEWKTDSEDVYKFMMAVRRKISK